MITAIAILAFLAGSFALAPAVGKAIKRARIEQFGKDEDDE